MVIIDWIIKNILGLTPEAYPTMSDKTALIAAHMTDLIVPYGQIIVFFIPFLVMRWRKTKFSFKNIAIAITIGGLLAWGAWWLDWWLLALGQASAFESIYGSK